MTPEDRKIWKHRQSKAAAIAALLASGMTKAGITVDDLWEVPEDQWRALAIKAGVNKPSETSQQLIIAAVPGLLRAAELEAQLTSVSQRLGKLAEKGGLFKPTARKQRRKP